LASMSTGQVFVITFLAVGAFMAIYYMRNGSFKKTRKSLKQNQAQLWNIQLPVIDLANESLKSDVLQKMMVRLDKTPVHVDLPRLARNFFVEVDGKCVWKFEPERTKSQSINGIDPNKSLDFLHVLMVFCNQLETKETLLRMKENFSVYFDPSKNNIDVSRRLQDFLMEIVGENCRVIKLLKSCNQSIIAPAVIRLKGVVGNQFPFKDVHGGWRIFVGIDTKKDSITVLHSKWEQSFEEDLFRFKWELKMVFDGMLEQLMSASLEITSVEFGHNLTQEDKEEIVDVMKPFLRNGIV